MTLQRRLSLGFALVLGIPLLVGAVVMLSMRSVHQSAVTVNDTSLPLVQLASTAERLTQETSEAAGRYGLSGDPAALAAARSDQAKLQEDIQKIEAFARGQSLDTVLAKQRDYLEALNRFSKTLDETARLQGITAGLRDEMQRQSESFTRTISAYIKSQETLLDREQFTYRDRSGELNASTDLVIILGEARNEMVDGIGRSDGTTLESAAQKLGAATLKLAILKRLAHDAEEKVALGQIEKAIEAWSQGLLKLKDNTSDMPQQLAADEAAETAYTETKKYLDEQKDQQATVILSIYDRVEKIRLANIIIDIGNELRVNTWAAQVRRDTSAMAESIKASTLLKPRFDRARELTTEASDQASLQGAEKSLQSFAQAAEKYLVVYREQEVIDRQRHQETEAMLGVASSISGSMLQDTQASATNSVRQSSKVTRLLLGGLLIAVVVGTLLGLFIGRTVTAAVRRIAGGLNEAGNQVASAAHEVAGSSQQVASGSSEQAAGIEETSSSLEEFASMTRHNAENAEQARKAVEDATRLIGRANEAIQSLTVSMRDIAQASGETQKIVKTIDEIAFQTNILALNAAVEAARAGEAGAGFAVVADEVRSLALRAAEAARQTANLIDSSVEKIRRGNTLVEETGKAYAAAHTSAVEIDRIVREIATASHEQSQGLEQINRSVADMDKVVQQNASNAQESAAASEELSAQSQQLLEFVAELEALVGLVQQQAHPQGQPPRDPPSPRTAAFQEKAHPIASPRETQRVLHRPASKANATASEVTLF